MTNARDLRAARSLSPARRTYWCLEGSRKKPSDYEVTTSALLYYPPRGFEVETPVWRHYVEHQRGSRLRCSRWDSFEDPVHTTYSSYVAERRDQEAFLDRLLERPASGVTAELQPLLGLLSALRFALHGQQMVAAYVGSMAPSGRIAVAAAFQAADEMRRIQRICQWLSRSAVPVPQLDALGRELWQQSPALQPWRRLIETLLVTYDFGLALVALNAVIKPVFDRLWLEQLAAVAERHHDEVLEKILGSLADDGRWHEMWFVNLAQLLVEDDAENLRVMREQVATLRPQVARAVHALLPQFGGLFGDEGERAYVWRELDQALDAHLRQWGADTAERVGGLA
jgi:toluene monooxygenase system protein E